MLANYRITFNNFCAMSERALDPIGYVVGLSHYGGCLRLKVALLQAINVVALFSLWLVSGLYLALGGRVERNFLNFIESFIQESSLGCIENYIRGQIEMTPLLNLILLFYDYTKVQEIRLSLRELPQIQSVKFHEPLINFFIQQSVS